MPKAKKKKSKKATSKTKRMVVSTFEKALDQKLATYSRGALAARDAYVNHVVAALDSAPIDISDLANKAALYKLAEIIQGKLEALGE